MKLLVDTNLLFSSISKPDGRIAEIISNHTFILRSQFVILAILNSLSIKKSY